MKPWLYLLPVALLVGCATYNSDGVSAMQRNDLNAAEQHFMQGIQAGDPASVNNMGVLYERRGQIETAVQNYTLAARWGNGMAQQNLARLGRPIPPPDLAAARAQTNAANTAATAQILRSLQPAAPVIPFPQQTNCTSRMVGNTVQTSCY